MSRSLSLTLYHESCHCSTSMPSPSPLLSSRSPLQLSPFLHLLCLHFRNNPLSRSELNLNLLSLTSYGKSPSPLPRSLCLFFSNISATTNYKIYFLCLLASVPISVFHSVNSNQTGTHIHMHHVLIHANFTIFVSSKCQQILNYKIT